jgi:phage shock protein PspC (stress-responsive transcriptional regulator)/predicted membrane protein
MDTATNPSGPVAGPPTGSLPWRRPPTGRAVAGVAAGTAQHFNLPVWLIRLAFVLMTLGGGFGLLLYAAGWLLIPEEGSDKPIAGRLASDVKGAPAWIGIGLIGIAVLMLVDSIGFVRGDLGFAAALVVVGILLYRGDIGRKRAAVADASGGGGGTPAGVAPLAASSAAAGGPGGEGGGGVPPPPAHVATPPAPRPPVPPRPRSVLGRLTFALALITVGVVAMFDTLLDTFDPTFRHYVALLVGVLGLGLLTGAWIGRARGLIVAGILLTPVLALSPVADFDFRTGAGERVFRPDTIAEIRSSYELGMGTLLVDLRGLDFTGTRVELEASVGAGEVRVLLPEDVAVEASGRVGLGELQILDRKVDGAGLELDRTLEGAAGTVVVDVRANVGRVEVSRGATGTAERTGEIDEVITRSADLQDSYRVSAGTIDLDLSGLQLERFRRVEIGTSTGEVNVVVPAGMGVRVTATVDVGEIDLFGEQRSGITVSGTEVTGEPVVLELVIDVDAGSVTVEEE